MIKIKTLIVILIFPLALAAQSVISSAGNEASYTSWSIGEIMTETITRSDAIIVQGFNQPFNIQSTGVISIYDDKTTLQVYPNPVVDYLQLVTDDANSSNWYLSNLEGKIISSGIVNEEKSSIDFSDKLPGVYILHIESHTNKQSVLITKKNHP